MKKFISVLFIIVAFNVNALAFVDNKFMTTSQYMQNTGYSAEMTKMMQITNLDPYREPYKESNSFKNIMKRTYNNIVPTAFTDIDFYNHNTNLNNPSWKDL